MAVYFTADSHFGHGGARGLFRRPFASVAEMDEALIARWNATVQQDDEVWHLGDFAVRQTAARIASILERLAGRIHLVAGNADGAATTGQAAFASVQAYAEIELEERRLVLCHYPFRSWNGMHRGAVNLHGHSHGKLKPLPRQIDVGVDVWWFRPAALAQLLASRASRKATARLQSSAAR